MLRTEGYCPQQRRYTWPMGIPRTNVDDPYPASPDSIAPQPPRQISAPSGPKTAPWTTDAQGTDSGQGPKQEHTTEDSNRPCSRGYLAGQWDEDSPILTESEGTPSLDLTNSIEAQDLEDKVKESALRTSPPLRFTTPESPTITELEGTASPEPNSLTEEQEQEKQEQPSAPRDSPPLRFLTTRTPTRVPLYIAGHEYRMQEGLLVPLLDISLSPGYDNPKEYRDPRLTNPRKIELYAWQRQDLLERTRERWTATEDHLRDLIAEEGQLIRELENRLLKARTIRRTYSTVQWNTVSYQGSRLIEEEEVLKEWQITTSWILMALARLDGICPDWTDRVIGAWIEDSQEIINRHLISRDNSQNQLRLHKQFQDRQALTGMMSRTQSLDHPLYMDTTTANTQFWQDHREELGRVQLELQQVIARAHKIELIQFWKDQRREIISLEAQLAQLKRIKVEQDQEMTSLRTNPEQDRLERQNQQQDNPPLTLMEDGTEGRTTQSRTSEGTEQVLGIWHQQEQARIQVYHQLKAQQGLEEQLEHLEAMLRRSIISQQEEQRQDRQERQQTKVEYLGTLKEDWKDTISNMLNCEDHWTDMIGWWEHNTTPAGMGQLDKTIINTGAVYHTMQRTRLEHLVQITSNIRESVRTIIQSVEGRQSIHPEPYTSSVRHLEEDRNTNHSPNSQRNGIGRLGVQQDQQRKSTDKKKEEEQQSEQQMEGLKEPPSKRRKVQQPGLPTLLLPAATTGPGNAASLSCQPTGHLHNHVTMDEQEHTQDGTADCEQLNSPCIMKISSHPH